MAEDGQPMQIKIRAQDGNEVTFRVKTVTPFQKIFDAYCKKTGQEPNLMKFIFDSQRLRKEQTPGDLEMEEGDIIDAMVEQQGGALRSP